MRGLALLVNLVLPHAVSSFASPSFSAPLPLCAAASRQPLMVAASELGSDMATLFVTTPEQLSSLRVGGIEATKPPTYEAVLAALMEVEDSDEPMAAFMAANRDLLDYRFLYRLTSEKLRAGYAGDSALEERLNDVRTRAVKAAQKFDAPLFRAVGEAEGRLGGLLAQYMQGKPPPASAISAAAGDDAPAIFAFWMVLIAAMAAWEVKLGVASVETQAREKIGQLSELRSAVESDAQLLEAGGITPIHLLMADSDAIDADTGALRTELNAKARALLDEYAPTPAAKTQITRKIGCAYCQCQRHGFQAYNPMVQRTAALYDILTHGELQPLYAVDIKVRTTPLCFLPCSLSPSRATAFSGSPGTPPPSLTACAARARLAPSQSTPKEVTSRLVKMANEAQSILDEQGIEVPLFW